MKRLTIPAAFGAGFGDGLILGIGIKTGIDPTKEGISMLILEALCKNPTTGAVSVCGQLWIYGALFFLIGIAAMAEDIAGNGIFYVIGLVLGAIFMLAA